MISTTAVKTRCTFQTSPIRRVESHPEASCKKTAVFRRKQLERIRDTKEKLVEVRTTAGTGTYPAGPERRMQNSVVLIPLFQTSRKS